jgi:hypothetical protein
MEVVVSVYSTPSYWDEGDELESGFSSDVVVS